MTILLREKRSPPKLHQREDLSSMPFCHNITYTKRHRKKRQRMGTSMPLLTKRINLLFESWEKVFRGSSSNTRSKGEELWKGPHNGTIQVGPLWYEWRRRLCLFCISLQMSTLASSSIKWAEGAPSRWRGPTLLNDRQDNRHNTSLKPGTTLSLQIQK